MNNDLNKKDFYFGSRLKYKPTSHRNNISRCLAFSELPKSRFSSSGPPCLSIAGSCVLFSTVTHRGRQAGFRANADWLVMADWRPGWRRSKAVSRQSRAEADFGVCHRHQMDTGVIPTTASLVLIPVLSNFPKIPMSSHRPCSQGFIILP